MIEARGEAIGEAAAQRLCARVAEQLAALWPDASVTVADGGVAIEGRGLNARRDADPALRWIGGGYR